MLDILGKRYIFFALSLFLIIPGLIVIAVSGLPLSIDFKGGTMLEVEFASGTLPDTADCSRRLQRSGTDRRPGKNYRHKFTPNSLFLYERRSPGFCGE